MARLTYVDKVALNTNSSIPVQNKIQDADMNNVKKSVNQIGMFTSATVQNGQPGKCYITMPGILSTGDTFNILFPTAVNPSANAQFSADGGTTYYPILSKYGLQVQVLDLSTKYEEVYFNGTNFILKNELKTVLYDNASGTTGNITINNNSSNYTIFDIILEISDGSYYNFLRIYDPNGKTFNYNRCEVSSATFYLIQKQYTISGTSINKISAFLYGSSAGYSTYDNTKIKKIIGYK